MSLPVGTILSSRYRISKILYQSKLANVYTVEDIHLVGNIWAVKEMKVLAMNSTDRQRIIAHFQAEVMKMTELTHPNLARVIDFFVEGRNLYVIREFIPAYDIETLMAKSSGNLKERDVLAWGIQLSDCLHYLYGKKFPAVFYRELALGNILVNSEGMIKIIDLGLARLFQTETNPEKMQSMGSMHYAPPEQFDEYGSFDQRSLVYSCGGDDLPHAHRPEPLSAPLQPAPHRGFQHRRVPGNPGDNSESHSQRTPDALPEPDRPEKGPLPGPERPGVRPAQSGTDTGFRGRA